MLTQKCLRAGHRISDVRPSNFEQLGGPLEVVSNNLCSVDQHRQLTLQLVEARAGRFHCRLDGQELLKAPRPAPATSAARKLLAAGYDRETTLFFIRKGNPDPCLRGLLGAFADMTVDETSTPRFVKLRPMGREVSRCDGHARGEDKDSAKVGRSSERGGLL